jgi:hypothetical protein
VEWEEAVTLIEEVLATQKDKPLSPLDRTILDGSWKNLEYKDIAQPLEYEFDHIRAVGGQLYNRLSQAFGTKITKRSLKLALEQWINTRPMQDIPATEIRGDVLRNYPVFCGRQQELSELQELIRQQRCVLVTGIVGVGKTTLVTQLAKTTVSLADNPFSQVVWLTVGDFRSVEELVERLITYLRPELSTVPKPNANFTLIQICQAQRCLLILDGAEQALEDSEYESFFLQMTKARHQSCIVLTSNQPPSAGVQRWQEDGLPIQIFKVDQLDSSGARELLQSYNLLDEGDWDTLINLYRGNPLYLSQVAKEIRDQFGSSVRAANAVSLMLAGNTIATALGQQTRNLTTTEKLVLVSLTNMGVETFTEINKQNPTVHSSSLLAAIENLISKGLIEPGAVVRGTPRTYRLPPIIHKYVLRNYVHHVLR